ncbi:MAG: hypothetical protein QOJ02_1485 [Acidobacteriota bacterium]|jgi:hypothetical protein|nr:hypothetical protein [Acidobacteriota bacterium]
MQSWLGQSPNWIVQTGIGAILGLLLPILFRAGWWILKARRRHPLHGDWYCYYFSTSFGKQVFKPERWRVSRSIRFPLEVRTKSLVQPLIEYQGHMILENDHILVEMDSVSTHKEKVYIRFSFPMAATEGPIVGLGVQYDYDGCPEASVNVLSREELSEKSFRELVKTRVVINQDHMLLRCI